MPILRMPAAAILVLPIACLVLASAPGHAADITQAEKEAICAGRPSCRIVATSDAGTGAGGVPLRVVDAVMGIADIADYFPPEGCRSTDEALENGTADGGREIWLLEGTQPPLKLMALCNDGYGAASVGSDDIAVSDNQIVHTQSGGSAWRWDVARTIRLSPLAVVAESHCSYHDAAPGLAELTLVDSVTLGVRSFAPAPRDDWTDAEIGCPVVTTDFARPLDPAPAEGVAGAYAVVVPFSLDAPLPVGATLGSCGLRLRTDGSAGLLVHGRPAPSAEAAEMRVIAENDHTLLLQVYDPLAGPADAAAAGGSWVKRPHVEIWTSSEPEMRDDGPAAGPVRSYSQVGITLDGKAFAGAGSPALPSVEHWAAEDEQGRAVTVLRLGWEDDASLLYGVGAVYSQAEGGKQARLASSAPVRRNRPLFLPTIWHKYPDDTGLDNRSCAFAPGTTRLDF